MTLATFIAQVFAYLAKWLSDKQLMEAGEAKYVAEIQGKVLERIEEKKRRRAKPITDSDRDNFLRPKAVNGKDVR